MPSKKSVTVTGSAGALFRVQRYAIHDGPGIRATLFFQGCPLSCRWCHNPESQPIVNAAEAPRAETLNGFAPAKNGMACRSVTADQVLDVLEQDRLFFDESGGGVTLSGGEPLLQPEFLFELLSRCREAEVHTALDTSGFAPPGVLETAASLADLILFDLKLMDDAALLVYAGVRARPILENLARIADGPAPIRIRLPLIPGITDTRANLTALIDFLAPMPTLTAIDLLPFHRAGEGKYAALGSPGWMEGVRPPTAPEIDRVRRMLEKSGFDVSTGG